MVAIMTPPDKSPEETAVAAVRERRRRGLFVETALAEKNKHRRSGIMDCRRSENVAPTELCISPNRVSTNMTLLWSVFPCTHFPRNVEEPRN